MSEPKAILVLSTCPPAKAAELAERLVRENLAACVNVVERVESFYVWDGKLNRDAESLLIAKTAPDRKDALREALLGAHPYEVPEVVEIEIAGGNPRYLEWVAASTRPRS
jgi:periplasmic divalent cation tolerance protein